MSKKEQRKLRENAYLTLKRWMRVWLNDPLHRALVKWGECKARPLIVGNTVYLPIGWQREYAYGTRVETENLILDAKAEKRRILEVDFETFMLHLISIEAGYGDW